MEYTTPDNSCFSTIKQALNCAQDAEQLEIALTHRDKFEIIYIYHPASEQMQKIQTVKEAKIKLSNQIKK